jgi:DNA-binding Lrp family transcriptional regulator
MAKYNDDLIFLYSENARARIKDLSRTLKKSPQRLKYAMKILEKDKVLMHPHCVFDYSYFGVVLFRVYFKGGYISESEKTEIIKKLADNPYVIAIYELSGEFDLAIEIVSPNPSRFNKEMKKVASLIPTLNNYKILLNIVTHIYPRAYLAKEQGLLKNADQEIIVGGDRQVEEFTENEMAILKVLLNKPKIRFTALAKEAGMNIKTAMSVLKTLKKRRIIKAFRHLTDPQKLGMERYRVFLKIHNVSSDREKELLDYMLNTKEIMQVNKTVGDWDMEIDIESKDKAHIRAAIIGMREKYKDIIENFNIIEFYQSYKRAYLPAYLFMDEKELNKK